MPLNRVVIQLSAIYSVALLFVVFILLAPAAEAASPENPKPSSPVQSAGPAAADAHSKPSAKSWPDPDVVISRPPLDRSDERAALEAVHLALTEVGDGSSYVWHRRNGKLSGIVKPTSSFRNARGLVCRHLEVWLTAGIYTRRIEGVACRQDDGVWSLEG
jgi:hypothetical protein